MNQIEWYWHNFPYKIFNISIYTKILTFLWFWKNCDIESFCPAQGISLSSLKAIVGDWQFWNTGWQTAILLLPFGMSVLFSYIADGLIFIYMHIEDVVIGMMCRKLKSYTLLIWRSKNIEIKHPWMSGWCCMAYSPSMSQVVEIIFHIKKYKS